jgi:excisionase family DNA binding protein
MTPITDHLTTQTVAEALGLSVSTINSWVDSGTIQAVRTAGGRRLISRAEALRLAHELALGGIEVPQIPGISSVESKSVDAATCDHLCQLLRDGQLRQARSLIESIYMTGCNAVTHSTYL